MDHGTVMRSRYYNAGARRRRRQRRRAGGGRGIFRRCVIASLASAALSLLIIAAGMAKKEPAIRLKYADEHSRQAPQYAWEGEERTAEAAPIASGQAFDAEYAADPPIVNVSLNGELFPMRLEEYLIGVVAAEMPASAEPEALKAQAVAARTFTALHMEGRASCSKGCAGCTVCGDPSCCQAYASDARLRADWGDEYEANIKKVREAVYSTRGEVVLYNGRVISALYHASSGPATESSEAVFAVALPYLVSVDSLEGDAEAVSAKEFTQQEFARLVNSAYPEAKLAAPLKSGDIDIWGRTESGRVQLVQTGETVLTGQQLRSLLGLKSTDFTVEISEGMVIFNCIGYGHGVGMSQYGANEMAKAGYSYEEILLHFYTGTELAKLDYANN